MTLYIKWLIHSIRQETKILLGIGPSTALYMLPHHPCVTWQHIFFFNIYTVCTYDSHEQENDITKEIRGNQTGAI
jgi:hypothetical protein